MLFQKTKINHKNSCFEIENTLSNPMRTYSSNIGPKGIKMNDFG